MAPRAETLSPEAREVLGRSVLRARMSNIEAFASGCLFDAEATVPVLNLPEEEVLLRVRSEVTAAIEAIGGRWTPSVSAFVFVSRVYVDVVKDLDALTIASGDSR